ncbi:hypothetical protein [Sporisorium scitamineum]|uniref:RRM domain-containing protein n=1 Tax=Sporisorium scitamineum TaxID=49012 RepID=A0A0F7S1H3_9BASI|nr:hypothetical protein [Sporisorium scitamineum]
MAPKKSTATAAAAKTNRPTKAAAPKAAAAATPAATTSKANGKKRAAPADQVDSTPAKKTTKSRTKKAASPQEDGQEQDAGDVNEREIIASLSDVSADSSDDEQDDVEEANSSDEDDKDDEDDRLATQPRSSLASVKLPNSKDDAVVRARLDKLCKLRKSKSVSSTTPGVLYIGRLPKGFFEKQLKAYFSQFGDVTRLRVSRNKKTGASKHYAFIEFADKDVAQIVQETMHNYLIDGRLLQVKEVPRDKVHPELWVGANRKFAKEGEEKRGEVATTTAGGKAKSTPDASRFFLILHIHILPVTRT